MPSQILGAGGGSDDRKGFVGWRAQKNDMRTVIDTFKYYYYNMDVA